ncbi:MAG: Glutamate synthase domain 2 and ferredoxin domain [Candidatus Methanohalarchaeum thermophilum]|uniref:Archaeal glutamate synthase [NADPH] n=1 Tax=Methanohalarchaeum thermophilum TaxID=1903181 RepID=A0A1Q6DXA8_METT1|nr:MAG: Glutamate synthase domain 2 and ferredoxin domain [Candidatus Methanohalarchaeum thermophilum]
MTDSSFYESKGTWSNKTIEKIQKKSQSGRYEVRGGSSKRDLPDFDDLTILPAQVSRPPVDKYREPCKTKVELGTRFSKNPLEIDIPIMIPAMSFGACSIEAKKAFAKAATKLGTATNTGEGGMHPDEREEAEKLIAQYASGRFGVSKDYLMNSEAIEIKIGQGAKAGMGGHLLGEKVTEEIAKIRKIPPGTDALSPSRHLDIVGPEDLKMKIRQLREITDWKKPIFVKYSAGRVKNDVKIAAKAGADAVVVDGMQGGTGAGPESVLEHAGIPTLKATVEASEALKEINLKKDVSLIVGGGIRKGADIAKALALGADACYIGTGTMMAAGCTQCGNCSSGKCPKGITTQDPKLRKNLKPDKASEKIINYFKAITEEVKLLVQQAGNTDINKIEKSSLYPITNMASKITGIEI